MYVSVAIDLALDRLFTYSVPVELTGKLRVGQLLRVSFGAREARGFALAVHEDLKGLDWLEASKDADTSKGAKVEQASLAGFENLEPSAAPKIKPILGIVDEAPFFSPELLRLVRWIAEYTATPIETCLRTAVPSVVLKPSSRPKELLYVSPAIPTGDGQPLTRHQCELLAEIARLGGGWMQQLCRELKTTPATLKALAQKGCIGIAPRVSRRNPLAGRTVLPTSPLPLNEHQAAALRTILGGNGEGDDGPKRPVLLHGVTGSGKTEIYLQAIAAMLERGCGAIVMVPEISLTPQTVRRFAGRFGERVAVLHSALSDGERYDEWHRIRTGAARVVVGPRSAIFAPVKDLGLIVVDEEHDGSYKQEDAPRYHARDIAVMRGHFEGARVVLGSATPSLESWLNVKRGKYALAPVPMRVAGHSLPTVHLVDLSEEAQVSGRMQIYSKPLLDAISQRLRRGEQTMLFINRRGYSRVLQCRDCGWIAACPNCIGRDDGEGDPALPYTYHEADRCLRCHVCGEWRHVPEECPECHGRDFAYTGIGTQRAEGVLRKCFPSARILRMDADSTARRMSHDDILSAFRGHKADILLGTQMIAKGLDFPNVTLVGVLNADTSLTLPDFRASERTYQLLAQVSGRAGRAEKPGEVFIQTFSPDAPAVRAAADGSTFASFADAELAARREGYYPPYCHLATLVFRAREDSIAAGWAGLYARSLAAYAGKFNARRAHGAGTEGAFVVSDAVPAALAKAEGWYRHQVVLRAPSAKDLVAAVKWIRAARPAPADLRVSFDVDALNLL
ncbi:MAG: primosomal protein N' [Kiritimatiellae bacterium]|nr:primosomal protein N' [Kiritimatiellia bacterium]